MEKGGRGGEGEGGEVRERLLPNKRADVTNTPP